MANTSFKFKQFEVWQDRCAMKVGTDGVLLGAWADVTVANPMSVLDIGTGTGLVALMMAQRFAKVSVVGIEIDADAANQASENAARSLFTDRISIVQTSLQAYSPIAKFDAIVCNPPFFINSLGCPNEQRNMARHANTLSAHDLMACSARLLADGGELSVVVPYEHKSVYDYEASLMGLFAKRICMVRTTASKPPKRILLAYVNTVPDALETKQIVVGDESYKKLTQSFYCK